MQYHSCKKVFIDINKINFQCAQIIKDALDKNYGGAGYWNVVVGESFDVMWLFILLFILDHHSRSTAAMTREAKC